MPAFPGLDKPLGDGVVTLREWRSDDRDPLVEMANDEAIRRGTQVPMVGPRARRRGVATEAVELLTGWAFDRLGSSGSRS
jgi:hypothetical protein